ncbi:helix-turn-helix domain-containing protein [Rhodobacteraceae bacterium Araon29]
MRNRTELLSSYPVLRTNDLNHARNTIAARYCDHRLDLVRGLRLNVRHNHVRGAQISLNLLSYGGDVRVDPGESRDFHLLQIPIAGAAEVRHRSEVIDINSALGAILNPDRPACIRWDAACIQLMVQIDSEFMSQVAAEEIGAPLPGPIRFDPAVNLTINGGRQLKRLAVIAARSVEGGALPMAKKTLGGLAIEREIARQVLTLQPSNISHLLDNPVRTATSPQIRRAIDFIHSNYFEDIKLEDIANASGAHTRTLQVGFQKSMGIAPITYLRNMRLDLARYRLCRRLHRETVTEVAYSCGFSHLGRFSRDYRSRFGHSPSAAP